MNRRKVLEAIAAAPLTAMAASCSRDPASSTSNAPPSAAGRTAGRVRVAPDLVRAIEPLGGAPWKTLDPFLFCVHHDDAYPKGDGRLGPAAPLDGRRLGNDFSGKDGFSMYHGRVVPGFPQHPHRGFETVTIVRRGLVDHSDSLGAAARYGQGDVQWLTAGRGIVHAEMFPLVAADAPNPLDLFQLWLNLPAASKFCEPNFSMLWGASIPKLGVVDDDGRRSEVTVIAGAFGDEKPLAPPPNSWAARAESDVAIWTVTLPPHARITLPAGAKGSNRALYFFRGAELRLGERVVPPRHFVQLRADAEAPIENGSEPAEILVLQGRPIGEPVASYGPFVMNTPAEIEQAFADYRRTRFGGWPWSSDDPVHSATAEGGRFARFADGRIERAT
jgi:redox-sensitive bicupin YhaK (pirin superfamily)